MKALQATAYRLHQQASGLPPATRITVAAGDIVHLLNGLWAAEKRADVADAQREKTLQERAEANLDRLLSPN